MDIVLLKRESSRRKIVLAYSVHLFIIYYDLNIIANIAVIHETKALRIIARLLIFH
jgi:hypothetical protein